MFSCLYGYYRWYPLKCKPGQTKTDYRGDLEVRIAFTVKAVQNQENTGSTTSIANKNKHKGILEMLYWSVHIKIFYLVAKKIREC